MACIIIKYLPLTDAIGNQDTSNLPVNEVINHPLLPIYLSLPQSSVQMSLTLMRCKAAAAHSSGVTARISQRTAIDDNHAIRPTLWWQLAH